MFSGSRSGDVPQQSDSVHYLVAGIRKRHFIGYLPQHRDLRSGIANEVIARAQAHRKLAQKIKARKLLSGPSHATDVNEKLSQIRQLVTVSTC